MTLQILKMFSKYGHDPPKKSASRNHHLCTLFESPDLCILYMYIFLLDMFATFFLIIWRTSKWFHHLGVLVGEDDYCSQCGRGMRKNPGGGWNVHPRTWFSGRKGVSITILCLVHGIQTINPTNFREGSKFSGYQKKWAHRNPKFARFFWDLTPEDFTYATSPTLFLEGIAWEGGKNCTL